MFSSNWLFILFPLVSALPQLSPDINPNQTLNLTSLSNKFPRICSTSDLRIPVPTGFTLATEQVLSSVTVGRGTQNYTCKGGTFVSNGAVANLYDASCIFKLSEPFVPSAKISELLPHLALQGLEYPDASGLPLVIDHYFTETPGATSGISPVFATVTDKVVLRRDSGVDAKNPLVDVPYLKLVALESQGKLAKTVFRLNTAGGQPPQKCAIDGQILTVPYAAMYYFTK